MALIALRENRSGNQRMLTVNTTKASVDG